MITSEEKAQLVEHVRKFETQCCEFQRVPLSRVEPNTAIAVRHTLKAIKAGRYTLAEVLSMYPLN